ncbi:hypothetical protein [Arthrobacter alpinus]|uniref:hypothetical protein n=1 Tax=Arthrobacter alpinus TaxID=656366 RepID=UPI00164409EC|nr:hypothetical protein [Arthrobacter alpinus]
MKLSTQAPSGGGVAFDGQKKRGSGVGVLHLIDGLPLPNERIFASMVDGWCNQQLVRALAFSTIEGRPVPPQDSTNPPKPDSKKATNTDYLNSGRCQ